MGQAAQYTPAGPEEPAPRRGRTRLLLVPVGIVLLLLAIPGGAYGFAQNQLSQAQGFEAAGNYRQALTSFATAGSVAGNPIARLLLGDLADRAQTGTAERNFPTARTPSRPRSQPSRRPSTTPGSRSCSS